MPNIKLDPITKVDDIIKYADALETMARHNNMSDTTRESLFKFSHLLRENGLDNYFEDPQVMTVCNQVLEITTQQLTSS